MHEVIEAASAIVIVRVEVGGKFPLPPAVLRVHVTHPNAQRQLQTTVPAAAGAPCLLGESRGEVRVRDPNHDFGRRVLLGTLKVARLRVFTLRGMAGSPRLRPRAGRRVVVVTGVVPLAALRVLALIIAGPSESSALVFEGPRRATYRIRGRTELVLVRGGGVASCRVHVGAGDEDLERPATALGDTASPQLPDELLDPGQPNLETARVLT